LQPAPQRPFSSSIPRPKHHKPKHKSISHERLQQSAKEASNDFKAYSEAEKKELAKRYNAKQMAAIEAGEAAIPAEDLAVQAKIRRDPHRFTYLDDFSRMDSTIDKKLTKLRGEKHDYENATPDFARVPQDYEILEQIADAREAAEAEGYWLPKDDYDINAAEARKVTQDRGDGPKEYAIPPDDQEWHQDLEPAIQKAMESDPQYAAAIADRDAQLKDMQREPTEQVRNPGLLDQIRERATAAVMARPSPKQSAFTSDTLDMRLDALLEDGVDVAPEIPKIDDPSVRWAPEAKEDEPPTPGLEDEALAAYQRVAKTMGMTVADLRKFRTKTLVSHRVVNQTRLGKIQSMYELCVAGNEKGLVGIGEGKAAEPDEARRVARLNAIRNMVPIARYEQRTIFGETTGKSGGVEIMLSARHPGFGCRTNEKVFEILRCAGIIDCQAKLMRKSRNHMNMCKAVWAALRAQRDPEEVARARGRKMVDVRKVYYSGLV
jgi:small subunit ribosomal protein S5